MSDEKDLKPPMEIPLDVLSSEALQGIIENFILREGTDYGAEEISHHRKIEQIEKQLQKGDIKVVFDANTETVSIVTQTEWKRLNRE